MSKNKNKGGHKWAFPIGLLVVLLAAIGFVTVVMAGVNGINTAVEKTKRYEEYEKILTPVVLIDPDTFDDITKADMSQLMEISLWSLLKSDIAPDTFESNESGLSIPKDAVEKEFVELFGTEITPAHGTIEGYGIDFTYDSATEKYTVPLTGVTPIYTPDVVDVSKTTDTVVLTVACLSGDAWEQGENGEMVAPTPDKYIKITLRENNENLFISAIQNTTAPEVATTEYKEGTELEDVDLLGKDDIVATESSAAEESTEDTTAQEEKSEQ
mgnify:CR=1 FL=1